MIRLAVGFGLGVLMTGALFAFLCPECRPGEMVEPADSAPYPAPYPVRTATPTKRPRPTRTATPGGSTLTMTSTPKVCGPYGGSPNLTPSPTPEWCR